MPDLQFFFSAWQFYLGMVDLRILILAQEAYTSSGIDLHYKMGREEPASRSTLTIAQMPWRERSRVRRCLI